MTDETKKPELSCELVLDVELEKGLDLDGFIEKVVCQPCESDDDRKACQIEIKRLVVDYAKKKLSDEEFKEQVKEVGRKHIDKTEEELDAWVNEIK